MSITKSKYFYMTLFAKFFSIFYLRVITSYLFFRSMLVMINLLRIHFDEAPTVVANSFPYLKCIR
jgi:hypothetical protein